MTSKAPSELEATLLGSWQLLREQGAMDALLPRCTNRGWELDGVRRSYVTLDYRVYRELRLPGAWGQGKAGVAKLVEMYWAVRTLGGVQDFGWAPSLVANVVELSERPVAVAHVEPLYRMVLALKAALHLGATSPLVQAGHPVELHVRGLLLGPSISEPAAIVDALANHADVPITAARCELLPSGRVQFDHSGSEERFWEVGLFDSDILKEMGRDLVKNDQLVASDGIWSTPE